MEIKDLIQQHTANISTVKVQMKTTVNYTSTEIRAAAIDYYYIEFKGKLITGILT